MELLVVERKIYEIRSEKVMLDFDLAAMYGVETKRLKEAVRRNMSRFPYDFMFELTWEEVISLRSQIASLEEMKTGKHSKYLPFAFTEQGVAMLSGILNSEQAIAVNVSIMRAFVLMRKYALSHQELTLKLRELEKKYDQKFLDVYEAIDFMSAEKKERVKIGY
jgi:hypothetical protein